MERSLSSNSGFKILLAVILVAAQLAGKTPTNYSAPTSVNYQAIVDRFQGETLEFSLHYKGMSAATSHMWIETNKESAKIIWTARTKSFAGLLFKIDNRYETLLYSSGQLCQVSKVIRQKNIEDSWQMSYDWDALMVRTNQQYQWPILADCQNILSLLYDLRTRSFADGDSMAYVLDVESQLWRLEGSVRDAKVAGGNLGEQVIVFSFQPALDIKKRRWKTDLLTNRLARRSSTLTVKLGPAPHRLPLWLQFGEKDERVEMRLLTN